MARTRVFISSTYYDLKHVRASFEEFFHGFGFDVVLSERGSIPYDPTVPLDVSCYAEARSVDLLILIIGGKSGSPATSDTLPEGMDTKSALERFFTHYNSVTKVEYETAHAAGIPLYVLVEASVYAEYNTYKRNRGRLDINYASVDNVSVFSLLDSIGAKALNKTT